MWDVLLSAVVLQALPRSELQGAHATRCVRCALRCATRAGSSSQRAGEISDPGYGNASGTRHSPFRHAASRIFERIEIRKK